MSAPEKCLLMAGGSGKRFTASALPAAHVRPSGSTVIMRLFPMLVAGIALSSIGSAADFAALGPAEEQALADYGGLPAFEYVALSPDGSRLAYAGTSGDEQHVVVKNL